MFRNHCSSTGEHSCRTSHTNFQFRKKICDGLFQFVMERPPLLVSRDAMPPHDR